MSLDAELGKPLDIYILSNDGICLSHYHLGGGEISIDPQLIGGFTAALMKIGYEMVNKKEIRSLTYDINKGGLRCNVIANNNIIVASMLRDVEGFGSYVNEYVDTIMKDLMNRFESKYSDKIELFKEKNMVRLEDIEEFLTAEIIKTKIETQTLYLKLLISSNFKGDDGTIISLIDTEEGQRLFSRLNLANMVLDNYLKNNDYDGVKTFYEFLSKAFSTIEAKIKQNKGLFEVVKSENEGPYKKVWELFKVKVVSIT